MPHTPGVYLFKDENGGVLYVGKARDLKKRVGSYLRNVRQLDIKTRSLLAKAADLEYVVTGTEKEALLLESSLIKKHRPRYNVILRDDKNYPALRIDLRDPYPRLEIVRRFKQDGALYFGPYPSAHAVRETLQFLNPCFPCGNARPDSSSRAGVPASTIRWDDASVPAPARLLKRSTIRPPKKSCCFFVAKPMCFSSRSRHKCRPQPRPKITNWPPVRRIGSKRSPPPWKSSTSFPVDLSTRMFWASIRMKQELNWRCCLFARGCWWGSAASTCTKPEGTRRNSFQHLSSSSTVGTASSRKKSWCRRFWKKQHCWRSGCVELKGKRVHILAPQRGDRRQLLHMARENARERLLSRRKWQEDRAETLERLQAIFHLPRLPHAMACVDISNLQGRHAVGSMVVFRGGQPDKASYRRYRVRQQDEPDDPAMMAEIVTRFLDEEAELAAGLDLLIVDGGKGQLNRIQHLLAERELATELPLMALAKETDADVGLEGRGSFDKVFLPGRKNPQFLNRAPDVLHLLQRIRDEAHRFAISYYQKRHRTVQLASILDTIAGIGPKRRQSLIQTFGSLEGLRRVSRVTWKPRREFRLRWLGVFLRHYTGATMAIPLLKEQMAQETTHDPLPSPHLTDRSGAGQQIVSNCRDGFKSCRKFGQILFHVHFAALVQNQGFLKRYADAVQGFVDLTIQGSLESPLPFW